MEARKKVSKEVARKQAARTPIALAKEELRSVGILPSSGHAYTPVKMDLIGGDSSKTDEGPGPMRECMPEQLHDHTIPVAMRRFSREAHRTWQRGAHVIMERQAAPASRHGYVHFPLLTHTQETPLMYEMMRPAPIFTTRVTSPTDTETTISSPTSSTLLPQIQSDKSVCTCKILVSII